MKQCQLINNKKSQSMKVPNLNVNAIDHQSKSIVFPRILVQNLSSDDSCERTHYVQGLEKFKLKRLRYTRAILQIFRNFAN